ncbi:MAG TPA: hypothetical protein DDW91_17770 [Shewanella frigidimarina]|nr:hypothetical protein [Shewanella frigidimarina]
MSDKNKISRLYSKGVRLNSALNQSRVGNKNKQELINKLTEQNKMLREALSLVVDKLPLYKNTITGYAISLSDDDCRIIKETLNISEL